jgi:hypothetical protein
MGRTGRALTDARVAQGQTAQSTGWCLETFACIATWQREGRGRLGLKKAPNSALSAIHPPNPAKPVALHTLLFSLEALRLQTAVPVAAVTVTVTDRLSHPQTRLRTSAPPSPHLVLRVGWDGEANEHATLDRSDCDKPGQREKAPDGGGQKEKEKEKCEKRLTLRSSSSTDSSTPLSSKSTRELLMTSSMIV